MYGARWESSRERRRQSGQACGALILDPFGGAGSTLIAAEKTGRRARLIELEPRYVDATIKRWEALTGRHAERESVGSESAPRESSHAGPPNRCWKQDRSVKATPIAAPARARHD